jgi:hypothetical protein
MTAVVQQWDGTSWSAVELPTIPATSSRLDGLAALTETDVWAVGSVELPLGRVERVTDGPGLARWQTGDR